MIKHIICSEFQDIANCKSNLFQCRESFLKVNYEFKCGNVYSIVSDFGCGSWGLVNCLGGRNESEEWLSGQISVDNNKVTPAEMRNHSAFVGETVFNGINSLSEPLSAKKCIEKALIISGQHFSVLDIKNMFCLSDERFDRNINYASGEINKISIAVNFALGKEIFCFPWLNEQEILNISKSNLNALREHNKIVLIPTSQIKLAKKFSNHVIIFKNGKIAYK